MALEVKEYFAIEDKEYWLEQIKKSDWAPGQFLYQLLQQNRLKELCGEATRVLLLTNNQELIAFCTLATEDEIRDSGLSPWIGFAYTFPEYRGHRYLGILLQHAYEAAKADGDSKIYLSTEHVGLYEKYGYSFFQMMKALEGEDSRVYTIDIKKFT